MRTKTHFFSNDILSVYSFTYWSVFMLHLHMLPMMPLNNLLKVVPMGIALSVPKVVLVIS